MRIVISPPKLARDTRRVYVQEARKYASWAGCAGAIAGQWLWGLFTGTPRATESLYVAVALTATAVFVCYKLHTRSIYEGERACQIEEAE